MLNCLCVYVRREIEGMIQLVQRSASKHVPDKSNKFCGELWRRTFNHWLFPQASLHFRERINKSL